MKLKEYLEGLVGASARESFAERVGTSWGYLQHVASGRRKASGALAIAIERETNGDVPCEETCPDGDWGYIRSTSSEKHASA